MCQFRPPLPVTPWRWKSTLASHSSPAHPACLFQTPPTPSGTAPHLWDNTLPKRDKTCLRHFLFSSVVSPSCLVTRQQSNQHQYPGFLGYVGSCASWRKIMSRRALDHVAFLRQPVQCSCRNLRKSQQYVLRCQQLHFFTQPRPGTPAEKKKGPDASSPGLSVLHLLTSGTCLRISAIHNSKRWRLQC